MENESFPEPLTVEEAKTVKLSLNPIKRLGQLASYGSRYLLMELNPGPLPQYMTRGDLVRTARAHESAVASMQALKIINENKGQR